jgi:hypothetical protein
MRADSLKLSGSILDLSGAVFKGEKRANASGNHLSPFGFGILLVYDSGTRRAA